MERETVRVADLAKNDKYPNNNDLCIEDWDTVGVMDTKQIRYDSEKGSIDIECVVKRLSDGKFFKFKYTQFGYSGDDSRDQIAYEVFPKQMTITYYE